MEEKGRCFFVKLLLRSWTKGIIILLTKKRTRRNLPMASITKDTIIGEILDLDQTTAPFFLEMGMHCLGCPSSRGETVEQACAVHGVNADELVAKLNEHLKNK
jgi:hybrid cluster-associated redox disulfide protein